MTLIESILLGIVQGITEFLPVSSSGHLAILQNIFNVETGGSMLFDIMLHLGTLVAVFVVYRKDIWSMIKEAVLMFADICINLKTFILNRIHKTSLKYRKIVHNSYRKFVVLVIVSTIPTGLIGVLGKDLITQASETLLIPGLCLLITGVLLLIADLAKEGKKKPKEVSYKSGLIIGAAQGLATLPGLSRSGTTIATCILCGLDRRFAVKYSFILSIPAILGAAVLEIKDVIAEPIEMGQIGIYAVGALFSAAVGYICIKTMLVIVRNKKFKYFAYYCFAVGIVAVAGHFLI
ncbi:MAG: undecaprenyl-diphosphate phosphatase [Lachnospiraceae bacterium]|uniref:undecaprenyl-diphosphate phosphatase n=1 Tax=Parablautia sp. Marseille-Q6255 TaxID=3039593 RepID=UPI0024BD46BB|nr:undecaprenyl-diphosphate phosphatase [Parablautia sp. Marseille-Q6255]